MSYCRIFPIASFALLVAVTANSSAARAGELRVSIGIRETNSAGPIGSNGGATGPIEWIGRAAAGGLDQRFVEDDGQWHTLTFNFDSDPVTAFAPDTANGVLESTTGYGVFENIRFANSVDETTHYVVYIDDVVNTVDGVPTVIADFEASSLGQRVLFANPNLSGSTQANIWVKPDVTRVTAKEAASGNHSLQTQFEFVDDAPAGPGIDGRWLRLTTSALGGQPLSNPVVRISGPGVEQLSFKIKVTTPTPPRILADYWVDEVVDGVDFLTWQRAFGPVGPVHDDFPFLTDGDESGVVDAADLAIWKGFFGNLRIPAVAAPEPCSWLAAAIAATPIVAARRRRRA